MKRLTKSLAAFLSAAILFPCIGSFRVNADSSGVALDESNFPDARFRAVLSQRIYDKNLDGYLSDKELREIYDLHCENQGIESMKGVEYLKYTVGIWCRNNQISELDLSNNKEVVGVWCSDNKMTSLDFSANSKLEWVYCYNCDLRSLNLKENKLLGYLECNNNPNLKRVDLSNNPYLEHLFISDCSLESLDVSNNPNLCQLTCKFNNLKSLNVSNNPHLKRLDCWYNLDLHHIDVSSLKELNYFVCSYCNLTELDVTHNPELAQLSCSDNSFKELDLSKNPKLAYLTVGCCTKLKKLDLSHNPKLYYLLAYGLSLIDTIDISNNSRLCKTYHDGVYAHEDDIGRVYSMEINYGGSEDPLDQMRHVVAFDDGTKIIADYKGKNDVPDCYLDTNDGLSNSEKFATREEAMWLLYEMAGAPAVSGSPSFKDVPADSPYADAIKWGQDNLMCFGYPRICDDTFCGSELINREDFALMAHRYAGKLGFGTAMDYGRTDWLKDFAGIDFYAWVPFTWAIQFEVLDKKENGTMGYPHGRMTWAELEKGANKIFHLNEAASYADRVSDGKTWTPPVYQDPATPRTPVPSSQATPTPKPVVTKTVITQAPDPKASVSDFVDRIYDNVLNREPEEGGAKFWSDELYDFRRTGAEVGLQFIFSDEFVARNLSDADFVTVLYRTFFGREPEQDGFNYWTSALANGTLDRMGVANGFVNSQEWADTCARYGIRSGGIEPSLEITPSDKTFAFVERMYTTALNRESDKDGKKYWSFELANFRLTGEQVGVMFFLSDEMNGFGLADTEFVTRLYKTFMDREPEEGGFNFWVVYLAGGGTREGAVLGFARSDEFVNKCIDARILPY